MRLAMLLALTIAGCGDLTDAQMHLVVKKCTDIGGVPHVNRLFNGKVDVTCSDIAP